MEFDKGDRVRTIHGNGTVNYKRYKPDEYIEVESYSVILDSRINDDYYSGTIISEKGVLNKL